MSNENALRFYCSLCHKSSKVHADKHFTSEYFETRSALLIHMLQSYEEEQNIRECSDCVRDIRDIIETMRVCGDEF